jgi:hypothetical protein
MYSRIGEILIILILCRWPALVIPKSHFSLLPPQVDLPHSNSQDILVCYFEDGSFSIVGQNDTIPFQSGLQQWSTLKSFLHDRALLLATYCYSQSDKKLVLPPMFTWYTGNPRVNERSIPSKRTVDQVESTNQSDLNFAASFSTQIDRIQDPAIDRNQQAQKMRKLVRGSIYHIN